METLTEAVNNATRVYVAVRVYSNMSVLRVYVPAIVYSNISVLCGEVGSTLLHVSTVTSQCCVVRYGLRRCKCLQ
jgi:hypothetical protein